jgi:hypothetical protein
MAAKEVELKYDKYLGSNETYKVENSIRISSPQEFTQNTKKHMLSPLISNLGEFKGR